MGCLKNGVYSSSLILELSGKNPLVLIYVKIIGEIPVCTLSDPEPTKYSLINMLIAQPFSDGL